jgi:tRNA pseudouridine55 synthase
MGRRRRGQDVHGWVVLDKPRGLGSTPALGKVRRILDARKAGHAGTLDPLAEGLLVVGLGEATKLISRIMDAPKTYQFVIGLGEERDTGDLEGTATGFCDHRPSLEDVAGILDQFVGSISQIPPRYSAIMENGQRAYDRARAGEEFALKARDVEVHELTLLGDSDEGPLLEVTCGKGLYVRVLAEDIAKALGSLGHVRFLRRTKTAGFGEDDALGLEKLEEIVHKGAALSGVLPLETVLDDIPVLELDGRQGWQVANGQTVRVGNQDTPDGEMLVRANGAPLALGHLEFGMFRPKTKFNLDVGEEKNVD